MNRAKMRKIEKLVKRSEAAGVATRVERAGLTAALRESYTEKTAKRLNSRLLRGVVMGLALLAVMGCTGPRVTTYTPAPPPKPEVVITDGKGKELLRITTDGKTWTWSDKPEAVILELIRNSEKLQQEVVQYKAVASMKTAEVAKSTETAK